MIHMTIQQLSSYLDAQLAPDSMERVGIHLSSCEECTRKFVALERQADRLADALGHDPGDLLSERFERMVDERILNGKRSTAPRPTAVRALPPLPESPPMPVSRMASADETVPDEAGARSSAGRDVKRTAQAVATSMRNLTGPRRREGERSGMWPVAWAAALILVAIVAGAGVVVHRTGLLPLLMDDLPQLRLASSESGGAASQPPAAAAAAPDPAAASDWAAAGTPAQTPPWQEPALAEPPPTSSPMPASGRAHERQTTPPELPAGEDAVESKPEEEDLGAAPGPDTRTATPRGDEMLSNGSTLAGEETRAPARESPTTTALTPAEAARQATEKAGTDPSASNYEAAARAWEAALGSLHGDAYQEARWRIAETRYRAWQMDPEEGQRASRATAAIRAYLIAAPPGEEREQARTWLNVIRESGFR